MWGSRRRIRRLEAEVAEARASQAELQQRLEAFERIAAAIGASMRPVPPAPVPPSLIAAAHELHSHDVPVRLDVDGTEVIAVVNGVGDPREWWAAICKTDGKAGGAS